MCAYGFMLLIKKENNFKYFYRLVAKLLLAGGPLFRNIDEMTAMEYRNKI